MKVCVVGGGLCGLTAAYRLSEYFELDLYEKNTVPGGLLSSYPRSGYQIERYYHHCFSGDRRLLSLMEALGISDYLEWLKGTTGYYVDGRIHPLNTPLEILRYPHLSLADKVRLGLLTLRSKDLDTSELDEIPAKQYVVEHIGEKAYTAFFEPLLRSKFGAQSDEVSAAWLISRIAIRSDRGVSGERLGYLRGGFHHLIDSLVSKLDDAGCGIHTGVPVTRMTRDGDAWLVNGQAYDAVLSTIAPHDLALLPGAPAAPRIPYQGAACMTLGLGREVTDGIYWLNISGDAPYGAVISHTCFVPPEYYGEHIVYLASYFRDTPPAGLGDRMLSDFCRRFDVPPGMIHWHELAVGRSAGPVYTTGYRRLMPDYERHGLFMAGMFSPPNYPERSMEGAVVAADEVTELMKKRLADG